MTVLVVVVVVAVAIALVLFSTTCRPFRTRIKALAFFAVILLHRTSKTLLTAVPAVEGTTRIVIAVIAISITLVFFLTTFRLRRFGIRIKALALFAVILLHRTAHTLSATVAAVEGTVRIVIIIIAVAIALVLLLSTCRPFGIGIKALALFAVILLYRTSQALRTAVAAVEGTTRVVVVVVAVAIALVLFLTACRPFWPFGVGIKALALFAVVLLDGTSQTLRATVAAVKIKFLLLLSSSQLPSPLYSS